MKDPGEPTSKARILKAAERIFGQKGFDGARVDEIAKEAKVNKALIYYYFKSKEDILEELFNSFVNEWFELIRPNMENIIEAISAFRPMEDYEELFFVFLGFLEKHRDILKLLLMESLKQTQSDPIIFKVADIMITDEVKTMLDRFKSRGIKIDADEAQMIVTEFFTNMMPFLNFIVYHDSLADHLGMDKDELKRRFIKAHMSTHGRYHMGFGD